MSRKDAGENGMSDGGKQARALHSAYQVFLRYGFKRTTMDDIAQDAGMSRPALYLLFKNKTEIFRALAKSICDRCILSAEAALKTKLKKPEKLRAILDLAMLDVMEELANSPHGDELMGVEYELAADIDTYWHKKICRVLAVAIGGTEATTRATLILDAINGMKKRGLKVDDIRLNIMSLLKLV
jgi:AcrR family transcriptional regulator